MILARSISLLIFTLFALCQPISGFGETSSRRKDNQAHDITFATFNVHYTAPWQEKLIWERRRDAVVDVLRLGNADIIGFQEMETFRGGHWNEENEQLDWILKHFPQYSVGAIGDPRVYPSTQPILFRSERFEALEQGFFFFSPTPERIYSRPWKKRFPAFSSWVRLLDRETDTTLLLYNVHFDHSSRINRLKAARLVADRISAEPKPGEAIVVLGDFNAPKYFRPLKILTEAGLTLARTAGSTFHFNRGVNIQPAIDHVLFSRQFVYRNTLVVRRAYDGVWPSDHYPVLVTVSWRTNKNDIGG